MNRVIILVLAAAAVLAGCDRKKAAEGLKDAIANIDNTGKMKPVKKGGCSVLVPEYMKPYELKEDAIIEYADIFKEFYVMVTSERKAEFDSVMNGSVLKEQYKDSSAAGAYADIVLNASYANLDSVRDKQFTAIPINGSDARQVKFHSRFNGYNLTYKVSIIQGEKNFYQLWIWCMAKDEARYADAIDKIVSSFRGE